MPTSRVLLVDDDEMARSVLSARLEQCGFEMTTAANVAEALHIITSQTFDVLLSDLHMPGRGDGLTVVSAMRHANPQTITLLLSAFPEMDAAAHAILSQTDEIMLKPVDISALVEVIQQRLASGPPRPRAVESVATILERSVQSTIDDWLERVQHEPRLMTVPLTDDLRCGHVPELLGDLIHRLRALQPLGTEELKSPAAAEHGVARRRQGYSPAMIVQESRMLQVSIFQTLQNNLANIDFSMLLLDVMTIADEVDSQLDQAMESYVAESFLDGILPKPRIKIA